MGPEPGVAEAILLVAIALSYIVFYLARREERPLNTFGYLISIFILIVSTLFVLNSLMFSVGMSMDIKDMHCAGKLPQMRSMQKQQQMERDLQRLQPPPSPRQ
jgi:hypothetical protein